MKSKIMYVVCIAYFISGLNVYNTKVPLDLLKQVDPSITAHVTILSLHQIGLVFMGMSLLCAALTRFKKTEVAFGLMTFLLTFWAMLYMVSWAQTGYWQSIYGIANYALVCTMLILISRIVEMPKNLQNHTKEGLLPLPLFDFKLEGDSK